MILSPKNVVILLLVFFHGLGDVRGAKETSQGYFLRKNDVDVVEKMKTLSSGGTAATEVDSIEDSLQVEEEEFWSRDLSISMSYDIKCSDSCPCYSEEICLGSGKCRYKFGEYTKKTCLNV